MPNRLPLSEAVESTASSSAPRAPEPPRYGQAAAIHALYQFGLAPNDAKPKPPRKPGGGNLARVLDSAVGFFRAPVTVPA